MKPMSPALRAHYAQGSTSLTTLWKVTQRRGVVYGFTKLDRDLLFEGVLHKSPDGFTDRAKAASMGMDVSNSEITGVLHFSGITEEDVRAGFWDGATVEEMEVNWRDLSMGAAYFPTWTVGNISTGVVGVSLETRGLTQAMQQAIGELYQELCPAQFGDHRCTKDLAPLIYVGSITSVANRRMLFDALAGQVDDYYGAGLMEMLDGPNAGIVKEILNYTAATGEIVLAEAFPFNLTAGETFRLTPGCRKRLQEDCRDKWSNVIWFRGTDRPPGPDAIVGAKGVISA